MQDQNGPPIDVLNLSTRSYNCLRRSGLHTVTQVAVLSDEELLSIRNLGRGALIDIRRKLAAYLSEHPLPKITAEEVIESKPLEAPPAIEPSLSESPSSLLDPTPLGVLGLSARPHFALMRAGITTIGQLAAMSREQIREVRSVSEKGLAEIEEKLAAYLADHPLPDEVERGSPEPEAQAAEPLPPQPLSPSPDPTPLDVLGLSARPYNALMRAGITTIGQLAAMSHAQIREVRNVGEKAFAEIESRLEAYLADPSRFKAPAVVREPPPLPLAPPPPDSEMPSAPTDEQTLAVQVERWLSALTDRQRQVIRWRYGLNGEVLTLDEAGERLGVTRQRVRQIQQRALDVLKRPRYHHRVRPLIILLIDLLFQAGGLMGRSQIEAALRSELVVGDVNPVGVVRLISSSITAVKWLDKENACGLTNFPLELVPEVNQKLITVLKATYAPMPVENVLVAFKDTSIYRSHQAKLSDRFILACLRAHPQIEIDKDGLCSLGKRRRHRMSEMILALREIGEPTHYSVIAEKVNTLLPPEQQTTPRNVHAELGRCTDLFVRVGPGIFGLKEWGLPDDGSLANAAYRVLTEAGRPLHIQTITDRVLEIWRVKRPSVHAAILNDDRFYRAAPATFGLIEWEIEQLDEAQPVLNVCPPPLPDRRGERNTFFESVLVARDLLHERPTTTAFLRAMLKWVGTSVDNKSERYLQNVLNAYYVVGLIPYTVYRRAADAPLHSTLLETEDLQALRRFCLNCMMERLARMPEFIALLAARQPCTRAELRDWFYEPGVPLDDVKNRVGLLYNLGVLRVGRIGQYRLTPLGVQITHQLEAAGRLKYPVPDNYWRRAEDSQPVWDVEFDVIDFEPS